MKNNRAFVAANEKVTATKVKFVTWSTKYDLIAVATASAKLLLFRLITKERVWVVSAPDCDTEILSVCWRPDGKVIAVGYSKPKHGVQFITMETHIKSRKFNLDQNQTASLLNWVEVDSPVGMPRSDLEIDSKAFLPTIPLWQCEADYKKKLAAKEPECTLFNVLLVCDELCRVFILADGLYPIQYIDYSDSDIPPASTVLAVHMGAELNELSVVVSSPNRIGTESTWLKTIHLLTEPEHVMLFKAATEQAFEILSLQSYLEEILASVTEECEVVSQDMETHLVSHFNRYAKSPDSIGEDLLQMLIWGKASSNLEMLFSSDVSKRDIKKLITLTESTYTKIQKDLTLNFQNALMNLCYHLMELKGTIVGSNDALPVCVADVEAMLHTASVLMFKTAELLQVIDASMKNFDLFFRWLYVKAAKIQKEPIDNIPLVQSKDMIFVADFINENFSFQNPSDSKSGRQFQIDKVYQYFKDEDLASPSNMEDNEWLNFVKSNAKLSESKIIVKPQVKKSLRQVFNALSSQVDEVIRLPKCTNDHLVKSSHKVELFQSNPDEQPAVRFWIRESTEKPKEKEVYAVTVKDCGKSTELFICQLRAHLTDSLYTRMKLSDEDNASSTVSVCDFQPFNSSTMTLLLRENGGKCYLAQLKMSTVLDFMKTNGLIKEISEISSLLTSHCPSMNILDICNDVRELDMRQDFVSLAVSGSRKVACVVASDMCTIYPFLMDSREDEEDVISIDGDD